MSVVLEKFDKLLDIIRTNKHKTALILAALYFFSTPVLSYFKYRSSCLSKTVISEIRKKRLRIRQDQIEQILQHASSVSQEKQKEILNLSSTQLSTAIKQGKYTCTDSLITYAYRAATLGIEHNIISDIDFTNNLLYAKELDQKLETADKSTLSPLFGVPITVKEHLKVKGLVSTCGITALASRNPETTDCVFVEILRNEGCVPFASTNVPQGLFSIESYNLIYGRAMNPHNQAMTTGGSSGGSCGAQALRLSSFGVGSDSLGSVRIPASFCGCYSFKGTGKRLSIKGRYGITGSELGGFKDLSASIGPVASCVDDLIEVEKIVLGRFNEVDSTAPPLYWNQHDFDSTNLQNVRIGIIDSDYDIKIVPSIQNVMKEIISALESKGIQTQVIDTRYIQNMSNSVKKLLSTPGVQLIIGNALKGEELINLHKPYVKNKFIPNWINSLRVKILNWRGRRREAAALSSQKNLSFYEIAFESIVLEENKKKLQALFDDQKIDIIISPVLPFTAFKHGHGGDLLQFLALPGIANVLDLPGGVIPIRTVKKSETNPENYNDLNDKYTQIVKESIKESEGLPIAVQVTGMPWKDEKCLKIMKEISSMFAYKNSL